MSWKIRVSKFIDILKSGAQTGAAQLSIPSNRDRLVSEVLQLLINAMPEERQIVSNMFNDSHSFTFLAFAERMASYAVRTGSVSILFEGLAAVVLEAGKFDVREDIVVMAPLYDAALKLGTEPSELFSKAAGLLVGEVSTILETFPSRDEDLKSLASMHYVESGNEYGFVYERVL